MRINFMSIEKQILTLFNSIITNFYDEENMQIKRYAILEPYMWIIYNVIKSGKVKLWLEEIVGKDKHNKQCTHQILKYDENISNIIVICDLLLKYVRLSWEKCELQNEVYDNIKNNIHKIIGYVGNEYYIKNNAIYKYLKK